MTHSYIYASTTSDPKKVALHQNDIRNNICHDNVLHAVFDDEWHLAVRSADTGIVNRDYGQRVMNVESSCHG